MSGRPCITRRESRRSLCTATISSWLCPKTQCWWNRQAFRLRNCATVFLRYLSRILVRLKSAAEAVFNRSSARGLDHWPRYWLVFCFGATARSGRRRQASVSFFRGAFLERLAGNQSYRKSPWCFGGTSALRLYALLLVLRSSCRAIFPDYFLVASRAVLSLVIRMRSLRGWRAQGFVGSKRILAAEIAAKRFHGEWLAHGP